MDNDIKFITYHQWENYIQNKYKNLNKYELKEFGHFLNLKSRNLKPGYEYMKAEQYNEAITAFEDYLDVNSRAYWFVVDFINNENYSRQGVLSAIQECKNKQCR